MKRFTILSYFLALAVASACTNGQVDFNISASGAENGTKVSIIDKLSGETITTGEVTDGALNLKGKADKDALLAFKAENSDWETLFFADGKPITVNMEDNSVSGSELNEKLYACDKAASEAYDNALKALADFSELSQEEQEAREPEVQALIDKVSDSYKSILEENSDNLIPVAFMSTLSQVLDEDELKDALDADAPYAKHPYTLKVKADFDEYKAKMESMEAAKEQLIGTKFIDLEEPDVNGKMHKLSEYVGKGKWVFIDFWASWCGPCRREMPNVVAAYKTYHPKGLEIVGLSFDNDKEAWVKAIKELEMPWIHLSDLQGWQTVASDTYNVKSIPSSLLVNPEGIIVARDLRGDALGAKLAEIFGK